jgi:AcrR family transcriptional regulator
VNRLLPTDEQVRTVMEAELGESRSLGRRATVSNIEKQLGVTHATFYRNYPDQIEWFKSQLDAMHKTTTTAKDSSKREDDLARLRRENTDLRKQLRIYAEAIRQLTLDKAALEDEHQALTGVTRLDERRRQQQASADNGHE